MPDFYLVRQTLWQQRPNPPTTSHYRPVTSPERSYRTPGFDPCLLSPRLPTGITTRTNAIRILPVPAPVIPNVVARLIREFTVPVAAVSEPITVLG